MRQFSRIFFCTIVLILVAICSTPLLATATIGDGTTPTNDPGVRFLITTPNSLDSLFTTIVGSAIGLDSSVVTSIVSKQISSTILQVDFTFTGDTTVSLSRLNQLQTQMQTPTSNGYQQIAAFYTVNTFEFYGLTAVTTTTATTTTTTPTTTTSTTTASTTTTTAVPLPTARFTWVIQFTDSNTVISTTDFATTLAGALGITTSRVSIFGSITRYNFIYSNITVTFTDNTTVFDATAATLVGNVQDIMLTEPASASKQLIEASYNVIGAEYHGVPEKAPETPTIIVTIVGIPNANTFKTAIANSVGVTVDRVTVTNLVLWNTTWNFTFQFTVGAAPTTSYTLAVALQLVFFQGTANTAYNTYLASLNSPSQFFAGLPAPTTTPPATTTTTTTVAPGPANWIQFVVQTTSVSQPISTTSFRADLITAVPVLADNVGTVGGSLNRMTVSGTAVDPTTFQQTISVVFDTNLTTTQLTAAQLVTQVMIVLKGSTSDYPAQAVFFGFYSILSTTYFGYDPIPETIVSLGVITDSSTAPNVVSFRTAVAAALGLTPATRIVVSKISQVTVADILLKPSELSPSAPVVTNPANPSNLWNYSFEFSASTDSSTKTSLELALALQTLFFDALVNNNPSSLYTANLAQYNSLAQYFGGFLAPLVTAAPLLIKSSYFIVVRSIAIQSTDFVSSLAAALAIPQSRIQIEKNQFQGTQSNLSFSFTEDSGAYDNTMLSWRNLTESLMELMFYKTSSAYTNYLQSYEVSTEYYGTEVVILTKAPPLKNPIITVRVYVGSGSFVVQNFKTAVAKALYGPNNYAEIVIRIETIAIDLTSEVGFSTYNFTFADPATTTTTTTVANATTTTTTAAPRATSLNTVPGTMTASELANYFLYLTSYKIDTWYITYLASFSIVSTSVLGLEYPMVTANPKGSPQITFTLQMPTISVNETEVIIVAAESAKAASSRRVVNVFNPINTTVFAIDLALTMSLGSYHRVSILSDNTDTTTGKQTILFTILPVANPTQFSSYDATLHIQTSLAQREDPLITNYYLPLFLERYTFISKSYSDDITPMADAAYPVTRNPLLPPKPELYSPYGSNSNGASSVNATDLPTENDNQDLIYGVVFGVLGAVMIAAVGVVVLKVFIFKPDGNAAKYKYAQV